jgi:hypothetical protein
MAKIKDLKDDVNYLIFEVISDCNTYMNVHPENSGKTFELIEETVELRNNLIQKIIHPTEVTPQYFKRIKNELINGVDGVFEKLRALIK